MAKLYFGTKKTRIIFFSVVAFIIVAIGGLTAYVSWQGDPKEIIAVADQFKPDDSWTLDSEGLTPPKLLCFAGSGHCPHISRTWKTPQAIDYDQLQSILSKSGWSEVKIDSPNCYHKDNANSYSLPCYASGTIDGSIKGQPGKYYVSVSTDSNAPGVNAPTIGFYITE